MNLGKLPLLLAGILVIVLFAGNFVFLLSDSGFHVSEFRQLGVNESLGMNVVSYVKGQSSLSPEFNEREASHLADVRHLFSVVKRVYYVSLSLLLACVAYLFISKKFLNVLPTSFILSGAFSLLLLLFLFLFSINFSSFFSILHRPFFAESTWVFPPGSILVALFPESFFKSSATRFFILVLVNAVSFLALGLFARKKFKQQS